MKELTVLKLTNLSHDEITASRIFHIINEDSYAFDRYVFVILGRSGPTGKTWLYNKLRDLDYNVSEISEDIFNLVSYNDNENHILISRLRKTITIILNKPIRESKNIRFNATLEPCCYWDFDEHEPTHTCNSCTCCDEGNNLQNAEYGVMVNGDRYCALDANIKVDFVRSIGEEK